MQVGRKTMRRGARKRGFMMGSGGVGSASLGGRTLGFEEDTGEGLGYLSVQRTVEEAAYLGVERRGGGGLF
jgi:hypothetical protein